MIICAVGIAIPLFVIIYYLLSVIIKDGQDILYMERINDVNRYKLFCAQEDLRLLKLRLKKKQPTMEEK
jgi:hypothetical protein